MARRPKQRRFFELFLGYWLPVLLYVTVIFALSAQPNLRPPLDFRYADKFYHLIEYGVLGLLLVRAVRATLRVPLALGAAFITMTLGILVGTSDEFFQSFIPGRESSAFDLLADTAGLALAQLVYLALTRE